MIQLIDLSSNNPPPYDLAQAKASGIDGVVIKLTEATNYLNPDAGQPWADAKALNLFRACYHFARPSVNSAETEAAWFLAHLPTLEPHDGVVLDLEVAGGDLNAWAVTWLALVAQAVGFRPIFYSYLSFIQEQLSDTRLAGYPLWLADYGASIPAAVPPWSVVQLWQYTESGSVPGISGHVDLSQASMSVGQLRALGKPAPTPAILTGRVTVPGMLKRNASHASKAVPNPTDPDQPYELPVGTALTLLEGTGKDPTTGEMWQAVQVVKPNAAGWFLAASVAED